MGLRDLFKAKPAFVNTPQTVEMRASRGIVRDFYPYANTGVLARGESASKDLNILLTTFTKDPVINAAITVRADACVANGFSIEGAKTAKAEAERKLRKLKFNYSFLRQLVLNAILYRHVFIEIVKTRTGSPSELHILETPQMEVVHDEHGNIESYLQRTSSGGVVKFPKEDIVFIVFDNVSTKVWGEVGLPSLYRTLTTKNQIEGFLESLALTNAWRQIIVSDMTDDNAQEFMSYFRDAQADPTMPLHITRGSDKGNKNSVELMTLRNPSDLKEFLGVLDYLRTQMLMQLKVPPILIGLPDNSNRSNSDAQMRSFTMTNESDRTIIADKFNEELFPALGLTVTFSWNPIDKRDEKTDIEIAEKLMNMGAKPSQVEAFLRASCLELPPGELFNEAESQMKTPDDAASRPSRQRADEQAEMDVRSGEDSSTRDEQVR